VTTASAEIIAVASPTVCAVLSSVCATTVDNSGVYVYVSFIVLTLAADAAVGTEAEFKVAVAEV